VLCVAALALLLGADEGAANAPSRSSWSLGPNASIAADAAGETGWLLGAGVGARRPLRPWLDLQLRLYATYRASAWLRVEATGRAPGIGDIGLSDGFHVLGEATARWRPWGPFFAGMGPQAGVRVLWFSEITGPEMPIVGWPTREGADIAPVVRGLLEVGGDFGPNEMFEAGFRFAVGSAFGTAPVERGMGALDAELSFTIAVLLPL
jgi:hypothetical protein